MNAEEFQRAPPLAHLEGAVFHSGKVARRICRNLQKRLLLVRQIDNAHELDGSLTKAHQRQNTSKGEQK